jgi:hypothetical protein
VLLIRSSLFCLLLDEWMDKARRLPVFCGMPTAGLFCGMPTAGLICGMPTAGLFCGMPTAGLFCGMPTAGLFCGMPTWPVLGSETLNWLN